MTEITGYRIIILALLSAWLISMTGTLNLQGELNDVRLQTAKALVLCTKEK